MHADDRPNTQAAEAAVHCVYFIKLTSRLGDPEELPQHSDGIMWIIRD